MGEGSNEAFYSLFLGKYGHRRDASWFYSLIYSIVLFVYWFGSVLLACCGRSITLRRVLQSVAFITYHHHETCRVGRHCLRSGMRDLINKQGWMCHEALLRFRADSYFYRTSQWRQVHVYTPRFCFVLCATYVYL